MTNRHREEMPILVTVVEAAERLSLSKASIYNLVATGQIACVRIGRSIRIPIDELNRLIQEHTVPQRNFIPISKDLRKQTK